MICLGCHTCKRRNKDCDCERSEELEDLHRDIIETLDTKGFKWVLVTLNCSGYIPKEDTNYG